MPMVAEEPEDAGAKAEFDIRQGVAPAVDVRATVFPMPAVAAAGVKLAYIVLGIGAGSIVLLLGDLLAMDVIIGQNVHDA
jgi:hypothetical protein